MEMANKINKIHTNKINKINKGNVLGFLTNTNLENNSDDGGCDGGLGVAPVVDLGTHTHHTTHSLSCNGGDGNSRRL
ncbi:MAG: hypothetical protein Q8886_02735 [Candidatus Phytoplasma australasiaticum]|nr:hypothetical protein [Candidatus Phytoplasma australasiaticum]